MRRDTIAEVDSTPIPPSGGSHGSSSHISPRSKLGKFTPKMDDVLEGDSSKERDNNTHSCSHSREEQRESGEEDNDAKDHDEEGDRTRGKGGLKARNQKALEAKAEMAKAKAEAKRKKAIWKEKLRRNAAAVDIQRMMRGRWGRHEASKHKKADIIKWFVEECKALGKMASVLQTFRARKRILEKEMADRAREAERKMMDEISRRYGLVRDTVDTVKYYSAGDDIYSENGKAVLGEQCPTLSRVQRERLVVERALKSKLIERGAEMGVFGQKDLGDAAYIVKARRPPRTQGIGGKKSKRACLS